MVMRARSYVQHRRVALDEISANPETRHSYSKPPVQVAGSANMTRTLTRDSGAVTPTRAIRELESNAMCVMVDDNRSVKLRGEVYEIQS